MAKGLAEAEHASGASRALIMHANANGRSSNGSWVLNHLRLMVVQESAGRRRIIVGNIDFVEVMDNIFKRPLSDKI